MLTYYWTHYCPGSLLQAQPALLQACLGWSMPPSMPPVVVVHREAMLCTWGPLTVLLGHR